MRDAFAAKTGRRLSRNDAVCAHVFDLVREADPREGDRMMSVGVNYRSREGISSSVLGNLAMPLYTSFSPHEDAPAVAARLRDMLDHYDEKLLDHHATERFFSSLSSLDKRRCLWVAIDPLRRTLFITSATKFGGYDVTFGVKAPFHISPLPFVPFPWMTVLLEGIDNRGLLFGGYFPKKVAERLRAMGQARVHPFRDAAHPIPEDAKLLSEAL